MGGRPARRRPPPAGPPHGAGDRRARRRSTSAATGCTCGSGRPAGSSRAATCCCSTPTTRCSSPLPVTAHDGLRRGPGRRRRPAGRLLRDAPARGRHRRRPGSGSDAGPTTSPTPTTPCSSPSCTPSTRTASRARPAARPVPLEPGRAARAPLHRPGRAGRVGGEGHLPRPVRAQAGRHRALRDHPGQRAGRGRPRRPDPQRGQGRRAAGLRDRRPGRRSSTWSTSPTSYDEALHARESVLVPPRWDKQFSALTDVGLEHGLTGLDTDVLVTVTPALLACAVQLAPDPVVVVHQEHRSSSQRTSGMEPLLVYAPRADVVALLTPTHRGLAASRSSGRSRPRSWSCPNPLPQGFAPRSLLDSQDDRRRRPAGDGEAVHQAGARVRRRRRPAARLAAADPRSGPPATAPGPRDPQARAVGPGRAARQHHRHGRRVGQGEHLRADLARRGVPARAAGGDGGRRPVRQLRLRVRSARDRPARGQRPARRARVDRRHVRGAAPARHRRRPAAPARRRRARRPRSSTTPT